MGYFEDFDRSIQGPLPPLAPHMHVRTDDSTRCKKTEHVIPTAKIVPEVTTHLTVQFAHTNDF